jgi:hypothetical protein
LPTPWNTSEERLSILALTAPFDIDRVDRRAERFSDRDEAVAELAGDNDEDRIAGAENIYEGRFHHRSSGTGKDQDVMRRAEDRLQPLLAFPPAWLELGAAVIEAGKAVDWRTRSGTVVGPGRRRR